MAPLTARYPVLYEAAGAAPKDVPFPKAHTAPVVLRCKLHRKNEPVGAVGHPLHRILGSDLPGLMCLAAASISCHSRLPKDGANSVRARYRRALASVPAGRRPIARHLLALELGGARGRDAVLVIADATLPPDDAPELAAAPKGAVAWFTRTRRGRWAALTFGPASDWTAHGLASALASVAMLLQAREAATCEEFLCRWRALRTALVPIYAPFNGPLGPSRAIVTWARIVTEFLTPGAGGRAAFSLIVGQGQTR